MTRVISLVISSLILICAILYSYIGGLLIQVENKVMLSNQLTSSGGDSSFFIIFGLSSFIVCLILDFLNKRVLVASIVCILFFDSMCLLANMDVSLFDSIKLGDIVLCVSILLVHLHGIFHLTKTIKANVNTSSIF